MKFTAVIATIASIGSVAAGYQDVRANFNGDKVVHVEAGYLTAGVRDILSKAGSDHLGVHEDGLAIKINPEGVKRLEEAGVPHKDATEHWINEFQKNFDNENLFCTDSAKECAGRETQDFYSTYQRLDALHARVEAATAGIDFAETFTLAESYEGRNIQMTEIGNSSKPLAFFICNAHAREWLTPHFCSHMVESLVADGGHPLLDTFSFAIITSANPDGYEFSHTDNNMWRKTRKPNAGSSCVGTDPNRNYDDHFCGAGTSLDPCSDIYCGITPFDQPETAAIEAYAAAHEDNIIAWTDFHSYGSYWLSPLGYSTGFPPADDYAKMSECMSRVQSAIEDNSGQTFTVGPAGAVLYAAAGASDDWFYLQKNVVYSFTAEMRGSSFQPDPSNIALSNEEIFVGMVAQMECVADLEYGIVSPTFPPVSPPVIPDGWTCSIGYYDVHDGCDCDCGIPDPDCDDTPEEGSQIVYNCGYEEICVDGLCTDGTTDSPVTTNSPVATPTGVPVVTNAPVPTPTAVPVETNSPVITPTNDGGGQSGNGDLDSGVLFVAIIALSVVIIGLLVAIIAVIACKKEKAAVTTDFEVKANPEVVELDEKASL